MGSALDKREREVQQQQQQQGQQEEYINTDTNINKDKHSNVQDSANEPKHYVVVGAGIVGVCIAFYLLRHPDFNRARGDRISIVESKRVAGGASGKAGGLLALWAFPQQIVPFSFQLHQELANEFNGGEEWGYRRLTTISVEGDLSIDKSKTTAAATASLLKRATSNAQILNTNTNTSTSTSKSTNTNTNTNTNIVTNTTNSLSSINTYTPTPFSNNNILPSRNSSSGEINSKPMSRATTIKKNSIEIESNSSTGRSDHLTNSLNDIDNFHHLPKDLSWIDGDVISDWNQLGNKSTTAQVQPYQFTTFILKKCLESNCVDLIIGKVDDIIINEDGKCTGIIYHPSSAKAEYDGSANEKIEMFGDKIILSIGPWTSKILPDCPISGLRAHSIIIEPENLDEISPYAVFTELKLNKSKYVSPEIYARKDEVYVCGEGDSAVLIPETTDDVEVVSEKCEELFKYVSKLSPTLSNGKILKKQACYLPVLDIPSSSGPLIGETNVDGLFLASGHSCWGINNAPATGFLMAELLIEGSAKSCDISALNPSLYFDASLVFESEDEYEEEDEEDYEEDEDFDVDVDVDDYE
ncbi:Tda3 protein [Martiniozyma asiatica (nom. inval.)]|nr:Tda3 protein [Martiniozyma asiatica]